MKRLLAVVAICLAVLLGAVGAYAYAQISNLQNQIDSMNNKRTFNFCWTGPIAEKFNVSTFWVNVTFERPNETNLIITVKTNHLRFHEVHPDYAEYNITYGQVSYVGIVFDDNNNGELDEHDEGYEYSGYNWSHPVLLDFYNSEGQRCIGSHGMQELLNTHKCTFDPELGYTYVIPIALQLYPERPFNLPVQELTNDLVHIEYYYFFNEWTTWDLEDKKVPIVEFSFGMELIA